ncbi:MAG: S9 family peptidase [Acetobacteraceae bacterium]|nr:S9 family peptidase [Acetobacteraceae bacterium]
MKLDPTPYTAIVSASSPSFSADGKTLFFLRGAGLQQVWALDLETGEQRQLTRHDEKVGLLRRAPNDDRLIYGIDAGGDERQQLWLLERGESRALTSSPEVIHGFGAWHPDGTRFSLTANDRDEAHYDILVQDLATGTRTRVHEGRHETTAAAWHKDGARMIGIEERATSDQRPFVLGLDGTAQLVPRARPTRFSSLRWDGEQLIGLTDAHGGEFIALCRIDPATGAVAPLFAPEGRDVEAWSLAGTGDLLATVENERGYGVLRVGPRDGERPIVPMPDGVAADLSWSADGTRLAFAWSSPERPSGLFIWENGEVRPVWQPKLEVPTFPFRLVEWTSFDGRSIPGWLALPPNGAPDRGHPAVIWVHGGPASQSRPAFRPDMQALLYRGYAVLMPNVRGSTGYGRASMEADDRERRLDSVHDLAAGRHYLAARPEIDPERIAVMGQSYGGYMVMAAVTEYPELWKAAINFYGIADFVTLLEQTGPWRQAHRSDEYGDIARHRALFDRISPIRHIDRVRAPLLVLHGTRDPRVPFGESVQIVEALQLRQRKVRFETFDYAGHGFIRPDDKVRVYRAVAEWLDAHV